MTNSEFLALIDEAQRQNGESEYIEYKVDNFYLDLIGNNISALANGAALHGQEHAYLIFGVDDQGQVVGTSFNPKNKYKNQDIKVWKLQS